MIRKKDKEKISEKKVKKKSNKKLSTRRLMNIKTILDSSIECYSGDEMVYFIIQPANLSVMSKEAIATKIIQTTNVLKGLGDLEMFCLNSRDNFENNKINIRKRMDEENNENIRSLLEQDLKHLDKIQMQTATARLFLFVIRVKEENKIEVHTLLNRIEKLLKLQSFSVKRANKEELKSMLAVYFEQNVTTDTFEDIDGERWYSQ